MVKAPSQSYFVPTLEYFSSVITKRNFFPAFFFLQIHLEEKSKDDAKFREALEAAKREVRESFEASVRELKKQHKAELQEGNKYTFFARFCMII